MSHLVLHRDRVPRHVDALNRAKWGKGLSNGVLAKFIIDGTHIYTAHDG